MLHGGDLSAACETYGGTSDGWLDLSTGINPHAYEPRRAVPPLNWTRLPDRASNDKLLSAARRAYQVPDHLGLAAAPGTQALISLLPGLMPEGEVAIAVPTYTSHKSAFVRAGHRTTELSSVYALPASAQTAVIVNPNNPDGRLVDVKSLLEIARTLGDRGGYLILDEAFADVIPGASILPHVKDEPVLVLRSFGKFFGLAGLRLGFLAGPKDVVGRAAAMLDSWAVSGPALHIGTEALNDLDWQQKIQRQVSDEMGDLTLALSEAGLGVFGGTPLYALAAARNAAGLHHALARRHIWTRVFDYAPTWIRIGLPGSHANLTRLTAALAEAMKEL
ncbi:L-threonine O-3-phosphate decarboxylase [Roseibium hamelinense]|uniref:threonine-phosphate decarboxylase n=1 Tax=Roseibium hamelinense TaxID=150831 RepID=A0A562TGU5_9HYPH|nr:threonine-phosphate decarboxylase CobD [Roseibium hamelinense]MTI46037.1 threonine-phosphate decarboxylase [Roseibium hamelinense]TWI92772.1 L-threonine O-3-phosphate decarboxylase [Roseibium hamelinense]